MKTPEKLVLIEKINKSNLSKSDKKILVELLSDYKDLTPFISKAAELLKIGKETLELFDLSPHEMIEVVKKLFEQ